VSANSPAIELALHTGRIRVADLPELFRGHAPRGVTVRFHASGHLALVHVRGDRKRNGRLELAEAPGRGHFSLLTHAGGAGVYVDETYRDGAIHTTLCTPWHDGVESRTRAEFRAWVLAALDSLASIAAPRATS